MASEKILEEIPIPPEAEVKMGPGMLTIKGPQGEVRRSISNKIVQLSIKDNKIVLEAERQAKKEKKEVGTLKAHIKNMISGVINGHVYKMKICSGHFPMNVAIEKGELVVKNFFGEKVPRRIKLDNRVKVSVSGNEITLEGADKEAVSLCAALIEQKVSRAAYDRRIFQDGIYIIEKSGKAKK